MPNKSWRTKDWPKCPCDDCTTEHKLIDEYGYFCDLACGLHSQWINREYGADAILKALRGIGFSASSIRELEVPISETITIPTVEKIKGVWVFIPDEE